MAANPVERTWSGRGWIIWFSIGLLSSAGSRWTLERRAPPVVVHWNDLEVVRGDDLGAVGIVREDDAPRRWRR